MSNELRVGDLVMVTEDLIARDDGFTKKIDENVPKNWLRNSEIVKKGAYCTFIQMSESEDGHAVTKKFPLGKTLLVNPVYLELISSPHDD